jgi:hypothetical protein
MTDSFYAGGGIGLGPRPEPPARDPYPAPLVTSDQGVTGPDKRAVKALTELCRPFGWDTVVTYAEGCFPHATTGQPGPPRPSLAVRMERGREFAVAVYVGGSTWSWDTLSILRAGRIERHPQIGDFLDALFGVEQVIAFWPWAKCPVHSTAAWHPPYVRSW